MTGGEVGARPTGRQLDDDLRHDPAVSDEGALLGAVLRHDEHVDGLAASMVWH
ncbi:hypothetical protein [Rhodococcus sp. ACS1]|uniref:hypothetical protein n=1 Tax=Rhodococcus sp. ACS1 TaxID=2028570 RepID=UPI0015C77F4A|nr:hypothetical protein [Rhodococcus sp. ACS1]